VRTRPIARDVRTRPIARDVRTRPIARDVRATPGHCKPRFTALPARR